MLRGPPLTQTAPGKSTNCTMSSVTDIDQCDPVNLTDAKHHYDQVIGRFSYLSHREKIAPLLDEACKREAAAFVALGKSDDPRGKQI